MFQRYCVELTKKERKETRRTKQQAGIPKVMEVMGHFRVCECKSLSVTAVLHASFGTRDKKNLFKKFGHNKQMGVKL